MSLDKNLFTLLFTPNNDHPNVIDLVDPSGTVHYRKQRVLTPEYKIEVYGMSKMNLSVHSVEIATRSHVRVVTRNSSRTSGYKQIQNHRAMQSYIYR